MRSAALRESVQVGNGEYWRTVRAIPLMAYLTYIARAYVPDTIGSP
jgi:hypothetical protein